MLVLTVLISTGLRWRDERMARMAPRRPARLGLVAGVKAKANRWVTAAALAVILTLAILGGLHWINVWAE
ncbi:hypothetical protein C8P66_12331 [Humitalea rosea]|uniref:Uncharacterized protein n=2 Tax=Humitalea rosea TaxID=990373 RepID=A0A2W7I253_9PROT|nr:hypothetical protein C8P66_12331 [Humitalea rosea]